MASTELLAHADSLRAGRRPFVLATVVRAQRPTSAKPGDCALVLPDGTIEGFVGGDCAEETVRSQGVRLLGSGHSAVPLLLRITPDATRERCEEGVLTVGNPCLSGGALEIFLEAQLPPAMVVVFGASPVARAITSVGRELGYDVRAGRVTGTDVDLPEDTEAVVVATHGRDEDTVLRAALSAGVRYIGLIASRRRGAAVLAALGVSEEDRSRLHTPAGLDIGARTPAEIAVSVFAELIGTRPAPETP
ncbi:XdhC family protein [Amycolatopsis pigmentata]|uniref:XdhC family protein n=1 Tax=Amycolatopsis pigmentata TaxID=450801 RepID=A0ABW5FZC5_9PSEU